MDTPVNQDVNAVQQPVASLSLFSRYKKHITIAVILLLIPLIFFALKKQTSPITQGPAATPTPTQEALLAHKAKQDMPVFLSSLLQPAYVPQPQDASNIRQLKDAKGNIINNREFTVVATPYPNVTLLSSLRYISSKQLSKRTINLVIPTINTQITPESSASQTVQYFTIKPAGTWKCSTITSKSGAVSTVCENFWSVKNLVKMGVGIVSPIVGQTASATSSSSVFFCEIYKGSASFEDKSCSVFKAQTGI